MLKLEVGQGVSWMSREDGMRIFGLVLSVDDSSACMVEVRPFESTTKCFNDSGAVKERDQHNVRLVDCPPPFSRVCALTELFGREGEKGYVVADVGRPLEVMKKDFEKLGLHVVDGGKKVSERMMDRVYHHSWEEQHELEKSPSNRGTEAEDFFGIGISGDSEAERQF